MREARAIVPRLAVVSVFGAALVLVHGGPSATAHSGAPGRSVEAKATGNAGGSVEAKATAGGMTVTLVARPSHPREGAPVHFLATATAEHATGAMGRTLAYGDGADAPPIAIPQFCILSPGRPASATWHFTHRYGTPGRYRVKFAAFVNCGGPHASVSLTVKVRA